MFGRVTGGVNFDGSGIIGGGGSRRMVTTRYACGLAV